MSTHLSWNATKGKLCKKALLVILIYATSQLSLTVSGASATDFKSKSLTITFTIEEKNLMSEDFIEAYKLLPLGRKIGSAETRKLLNTSCKYMFYDNAGARLISQDTFRGVKGKRTLVGGNFKWGFDENQEVILEEVVKCRFRFSGIELKPGNVWEIGFWQNDSGRNGPNRPNCTLIKRELEELKYNISFSTVVDYRDTKSLLGQEDVSWKSNLSLVPLTQYEYANTNKRTLESSICTGDPFSTGL